MKRMRLVLMAVLTMATYFAQAQTADDIMYKHAAALGGEEAWNHIKTLKMTGGFSQGGVDVNLTQTIAIGKAMRMDISAMGIKGFQIVTLKDGWTYMPFAGTGKLDTMKPEMVKTFQKQMDVKSHQMLDYKANGVTAEYAGRDTISSIPCYRIKFTDHDGNESMSYFDCNTYYLLRTDSKVKQDDQEQEVSVVYDHYKKLDGGIVMPMSVNAGGVDIAFKSIEINKPVDDKLFVPDIPKEK